MVPLPPGSSELSVDLSHLRKAFEGSGRSVAGAFKLGGGNDLYAVLFTHVLGKTLTGDTEVRTIMLRCTEPVLDALVNGQESMIFTVFEQVFKAEQRIPSSPSPDPTSN